MEIQMENKEATQTMEAAAAAQAAAAAAAADTTSFHFKSTKSIAIAPTGKDEAGNFLFDEVGSKMIAEGWKYDEAKGWKRPSVDAKLPSLDTHGLLSILEKGGQGAQFLMSIANGQFYEVARSKINDLLNDNSLVVITPETITSFDYDWGSMAAAYLEAEASARATGVSKETYEEFVSDYVEVMLRELPENGEDKIKNAAEHLKLRFQKCRSNKAMVGKLRDYLALWYAATKRQEEFSKLYKTLDDRAAVLLTTNDEDSI
jgi:hypothetical protein